MAKKTERWSGLSLTKHLGHDVNGVYDECDCGSDLCQVSVGIHKYGTENDPQLLSIEIDGTKVYANIETLEKILQAAKEVKSDFSSLAIKINEIMEAKK